MARFASGQADAQGVNLDIRFSAKTAVQQGERVGVAFKLAQDLDMRDHPAPHDGNRPRLAPRQDLVRAFEITG